MKSSRVPAARPRPNESPAPKPWWPVVPALACLGAYLVTLPPGLVGGDSGELAVVAARFSVAHPPGYPLYVVLGKLFTLLPFGTVAQRLNVLSAFCGAGAVGLLSAALLRITRRPLPALVAALGFGLSPLAWTWATRAEVFSLNNLFAALLLWLAADACARPSTPSLSLFGLAFGVGLGNHLTLLLVGVPLLVACGVSARGNRRALAACVIALAAGLFIYLQLPIGAAVSPEDAWGDTGTLRGFLRHVLREEYGTFQLAKEQQGSFGASMAAFLPVQLAQLVFGGALLGAVGAWLAFSLRRPLLIAVVAAWLLSAIGFHVLARFPSSDPLMLSVLSRFWQLPLLLSWFLAGVGLFAVGERIVRPRLWWGVGAALCVGQLAMAIGNPVIREQRRDTRVDLYGRELIASLPPNAVLIARGDLLSNAARYTVRAAGLREDVTVLDGELMTYPWYVRAHANGSVHFPGERYGDDGFALAQLVAANPARPFFIVGEVNAADASLQNRIAPHGLAQRVLMPSENLRGAFTESERVLQQLHASPFGAAAVATPHPADIWSVAAVQEYWEAQHRLPLGRLTYALEHREDTEVARAAVSGFEALLTAHPEAPAVYFKNAAIAYSLVGDAVKERAALQRYVDLAPTSDPQRAAAIQLLQGQ